MVYFWSDSVSSFSRIRLFFSFAHTPQITIALALVCAGLGVSRARYYRQQQPQQEPKPKPKPQRALSDEERQQVLDLLHSERCVDQSPQEVYATLLDEGRYPCFITLGGVK